jgi:hypothetical protein
MSDYIDTIKKDAHCLSNMGVEVPEWMFVSFLIFKLSDIYAMLITVLENSTRANLSFDEAVEVLLEKSCCKTLNEDLVALITRVTKNTKNATKQCSYFNKEGHMNERCWKLYPELCCSATTKSNNGSTKSKG